MGKEKFYVVWKGVTPGVYTRWTECQLQTKGFEGAIYKSFETHEEARKAFLSSPYEYLKKSTDGPKKKPQPGTIPPSVPENSLAVDAACSGNPGMYVVLFKSYRKAIKGELQSWGVLKRSGNVADVNIPQKK